MRSREFFAVLLVGLALMTTSLISRALDAPPAQIYGTGIPGAMCLLICGRYFGRVNFRSR
ncbi:MAG: hypothetical protein Q8O67_33115 [Deltaproteobacteria bacterium]|nr:hypothetical protein [Deltaproteobacteria bacterium]